MGEIASAGNKGKGIRSDCFVTLELTDQGESYCNLNPKLG